MAMNSSKFPVIRVMNVSDLPRAHQIRRQAAFNQTVADWRMLLELEPRGCFVATIGEHVVGTVTSTIYSAELAWIGMVLVDIEYRHQGIAGRLLEYVLEYLDIERHITTVGLDATPDGRRLYDKLGFTVQYSLHRWQGTAPSARNSLDPRVRPVRPEDTPQLARLDAQVFGVERTSLISSMVEKFGDTSVVIEEDGRITGWALRRRGTTRWHVGPLLAHDLQDAQRLLETIVAPISGDEIEVDLVDGRNTRQLAEALQLSRIRPFLRMTRDGSVPAPDALPHYHASIAPEVG